MIYFTINLRSLSDQTAIRHCIFCNVLRRNDISPCINPPVFFIQVKLRNNVDQFHIRFPVGTQSSYILPVAIILVGKKSLPFVFTVRKDMLTKITVTLCFQCQQSFLQYRPAEYVNSHGSQITARLLRFLLEFPHTSLLIRHHNPESACFFHRNRHTCNRNIRFICLMEIQHYLIVHLIDVIPGKDQHIIRIVLFHVIKILEDCIRCSGIPFTVVTPLIRRKHSHTAFISIQIPRDSNSDMCVQTQWLILSQNSHCINA